MDLATELCQIPAGKGGIMQKPAKRLGLREAVDALKRQRVLDEARRLFFELGYRGTTMEAIADAVEMGKPFIYRHFKTKVEILGDLYDQAITLSDEALNRAIAAKVSPDETIRTFVRNYLNVVVNEREVVAIFFRESVNVPLEKLRQIDSHKRAFDKKLAAVIEGGIHSGHFHVPDARVGAFAIVGMVNWSYQWYRERGPRKPEELGEIFAEFALSILKTKSPRWS